MCVPEYCALVIAIISMWETVSARRREAGRVGHWLFIGSSNRSSEGYEPDVLLALHHFTKLLSVNCPQTSLMMLQLKHGRQRVQSEGLSVVQTKCFSDDQTASRTSSLTASGFDNLCNFLKQKIWQSCPIYDWYKEKQVELLSLSSTSVMNPSKGRKDAP